MFSFLMWIESNLMMDESLTYKYLKNTLKHTTKSKSTDES